LVALAAIVALAVFILFAVFPDQFEDMIDWFSSDYEYPTQPVEDVTLMQASDHAVQKHGSVANTIDDICRDTGGVSTMANMNTNRKAVICRLEVDGITYYGVSIYEKGKNISSFLKEKMRTLDQVEQYLNNQGYVK
jgi:hypothetical protein